MKGNASGNKGTKIRKPLAKRQEREKKKHALTQMELDHLSQQLKGKGPVCWNFV